MAAKKDDPTMKELKRRLHLQGTLAELDSVFGKRSGYLYNLFGHEAKLSVPFLWKLDSLLGISPSAILRAVKQEPFEDPVEGLMAHRESTDLPASPFLDELLPRVEALRESEVGRDVTVASEFPVLEALEEQRFSDRTQAREACERPGRR